MAHQSEVQIVYNKRNKLLCVNYKFDIKYYNVILNYNLLSVRPIPSVSSKSL